jgi:glycine/D-amino acid oxidase-like deaminating enzyme
MLSMGAPESAMIAGMRASAAEHRLAVRDLDAAGIRRMYPAFSPPDGHVGIFEPAAGWVDVDAALRGARDLAVAAGARVELDSPVTGWEKCAGGIRLHTAGGDFDARKLIVTAGAWAGELLRDLGLPLRVERKILIWLEPLTAEWFSPEGCPVFAFAENFFYGFPNIGGHGVKLAIHWQPGTPLSDLSQPAAPAAEEDIEPVLEMAARLLPGLAGPLPGAHARVLRTKTCLYTLTPDENFIIDRHPRVENFWFAAGFSGHGFKFAPAIGEALADLATRGSTALPIGFLGLQGRFRN